MQAIKEVRFIVYNDGKKANEENAIKWTRIFGKIENILEDFGIMPEVATITQDGCEMVVSLHEDFTIEKAIMVLTPLEKLFKVTHFDFETEPDEWDETAPHVCYGFYEI